MWTAVRVLLGIFLILLMTTQSAMAQLGPWVEAASASTEQVDQSQVVAEPDETTGDTPDDVVEDVAVPSSQSRPDSGSIRLGLPRVRAEEQPIGGGDELATPLKLGKEFVRTVATLAGVLMLIFALAHVYKRIARTNGGLSGQIGAGGRAPAGLVEVLGRYPISSGMTLVVLRFDRKVLLLSHAGGGRGGRKGLGGAGSMQTLCEVGSAEDVASILGKVRDESGESIAASFEKTLQEAGNATDQEISKAMYQPSPGVHVQRTRRVAPGFVSNDEGDRLELTSHNDSSAASQVLRRRLGAMRRGR